jgi:protein-S-isoprenylcysteine O-methyltransferase Ste14
MLKIVALVELGLCWVAWSLAFLRPHQETAVPEKVAGAPASKWGIFLEMVGFALAWTYSLIIGPPSVALAWAATRHLGKQWRFAAALRKDHELITTGPYGWVRHPIYTSMLGMLLATGAAYTWWPMFAAALIFFLVGTEIRIRSEERLLAEHFQDSFVAYRARVRGYIPFVR